MTEHSIATYRSTQDALRHVYRHTTHGWQHVRTCQSFDDACAWARWLESSTGIPHCVNT